MNKRILVFFISLIAFLSTSFLVVRHADESKVTPENFLLTNFNKINSGGSFPFGIKTVVIDAGHGGKDPGCIGITNVYEKDVALGIALKLGKYIEEKISDVKVIYTRSTDVFVELDERAAIANKYKADLFICIHCNTACSIDKKTKKTNCNPDVFGTETYVMGLHKTNANLNVAMRENSSILMEKNYSKRYEGFDPNSETGYILLTMQQNAYLKQSLNFASKVQKQVKEKAGRVDKGVQQAGFLVLWRTAMPSVLIETEFISSPSAEKFVGGEKGQDYMARAIFSAFRQYKDEVEGKLMKYEDEIENTPKYVPEKDTSGSKGNKDASTSLSVTSELKKDSVKKKEPVIESEEKIKASPKDSIPQLMPRVDTARSAVSTKKDSIPKLKVKSEKLEVNIKKDSTNNGQLTTGNGLIIYKVQFLSSSQRIPLVSDKFKGLKDIGEYRDGAAYKYTAGEFKTIDDAMKYRAEMQSKGYKDCFVVKFKDGARMKN
ncbi:MAG: N-acetylmuramoyl-L-alanine amidase [Bacteroidetes bacterium]|nr:N-acetylmuramoyl-L-alanine amidase [Bacteroidota bacterium]